jgi:hypothetical protein
MTACRLEVASDTATCSEQGTQPMGCLRAGGTGQWRDFGIACQPRGLWRRSGHSTQLLRVMPETWGRAAGLWRCPRLCGGGREP